MVQISEVRGNSRDNRTAAHTHIKGLGLNANGIAEKQAAGFVGQTAAREVSNSGGSWQGEQKQPQNVYCVSHGWSDN